MTRKNDVEALANKTTAAVQVGIARTEKRSSSNQTPKSSVSKASKFNQSKTVEPSTSTLIICRNKWVWILSLKYNFDSHHRHWRYISSFHGPWLQLPPEVLESLAFSNFASPRPRPIDPAVFFDLVKIRRLVEESTNLAVRAANGTTSSTLSNSINAGNGLLGGGGAAALGLGLGDGGPNAKLSRERKHRMRELATQKLSQAYALDEIAASVATMQSASSLEEVAKLVLQRNAKDSDAKYVHFFHEKIPSRMLAQCTSLNTLDDIVREKANNIAALRTRAVTKVFKDDLMGAARDLTEALSSHRYNLAQHNAERGQRETINPLESLDQDSNDNGDLSYDRTLEKVEEPDSSGPQLLFHRAGVYLALACRNIKLALDGLQESYGSQEEIPSQRDTSSTLSASEPNSLRLQLEARRLVKTNAKRALRDYTSFLSNFDYTPGVPYAVTEEHFRKVNAAHVSSAKFRTHPTNKLLEMSGNTSLSNGSLSDSLTTRKVVDRSTSIHQPNYMPALYPLLPTRQIYQVSSLFSSSPPADLPPYPDDSTSLVLEVRTAAGSDRNPYSLGDRFEGQEAVTYHPLFTDAIHSLLLCHSLMQTSAKEHLRHAHMVGRLARICDGYPIFLAARSSSRADWIEIIRRASNWIGLQQSWETLCAPAPLPGQNGSTKKESEEQAKERIRQEAIMEALADERVHDEASFQAAVEVREKRAEEQRKETQAEGGAKRWAQSNSRDYPISTERAEVISRWVREAPRTSVTSKKANRIGKCKQGTQLKEETILQPSENS